MNSWKANNIKASLVLSVIILVCLITYTESCFALHPETHAALNEYIAKGTILDDYLKNQLGMQNGIGSDINQKKIWEFFREGGAKEDSGTRCFNHFHNPLTNKGLAIGQSTLLWATLPLEQQKLAPLTSLFNMGNRMLYRKQTFRQEV